MVIVQYIYAPFSFGTVIKRAVRISELARGGSDNTLISGNGFEEVHTGIAFYPPSSIAHWSDQLLSPDRAIDYLLLISKPITSEQF